jgi:hypothetical protein
MNVLGMVPYMWYKWYRLAHKVVLRSNQIYCKSSSDRTDVFYLFIYLFTYLNTTGRFSIEPVT